MIKSGRSVDTAFFHGANVLSLVLIQMSLLTQNFLDFLFNMIYLITFWKHVLRPLSSLVSSVLLLFAETMSTCQLECLTATAAYLQHSVVEIGLRDDPADRIIK